MLRPLHKSTDHQPTTSAKPSTAARSLAKPTLSVTTDTTIHATPSAEGAKCLYMVRSRGAVPALGRFRFFDLSEEVPKVVGNILLRQAQRKQWSDQPASNAAEVANRQDLH